MEEKNQILRRKSASGRVSGLAGTWAVSPQVGLVNMCLGGTRPADPAVQAWGGACPDTWLRAGCEDVFGGGHRRWSSPLSLPYSSSFIKQVGGGPTASHIFLERPFVLFCPTQPFTVPQVCAKTPGARCNPILQRGKLRLSTVR